MTRRGCASARRGLAFYRGRYAEHRTKMGAGSTVLKTLERPRSCDRARHLAERWRAKAHAARLASERWFERMRWDSVLAIRHVFGIYAAEALEVARCESGYARTPRAHNGQYLGMFQMGDYARTLYGHGPSPLEQSRAAWRYFVASGRDWSPWSCRP